MTTAIKPADLKNLLYGFRDDAEMAEVIMDALASFEKYHKCIYEMETRKYLHDCGAMSDEAYREEIPVLDQQRTNAHNEVLSNVKILNRLAEEMGMEPIYDGVVSEERPYRREVANAVLAFVEQVMQDRS